MSIPRVKLNTTTVAAPWATQYNSEPAEQPLIIPMTRITNTTKSDFNSVETHNSINIKKEDKRTKTDNLPTTANWHERWLADVKIGRDLQKQSVERVPITSEWMFLWPNRKSYILSSLVQSMLSAFHTGRLRCDGKTESRSWMNKSTMPVMHLSVCSIL